MRGGLHEARAPDSNVSGGELRGAGCAGKGEDGCGIAVDSLGEPVDRREDRRWSDCGGSADAAHARNCIRLTAGGDHETHGSRRREIVEARDVGDESSQLARQSEAACARVELDAVQVVSAKRDAEGRLHRLGCTGDGDALVRRGDGSNREVMRCEPGCQPGQVIIGNGETGGELLRCQPLVE